MPTSSEPTIVVIGAGVIGLQICLTLLEAGHHVLVVAKHLPGDLSIEYTSPWAGAHWRPHGTADDVEQCSWDLQTYEKWLQIHKQEVTGNIDESKRSGIAPVPSRLQWGDGQYVELGASQSPEGLRFAKHVRDFEILPNLQGGIPEARFTTLAVNVPKYLHYLVRRIRELGGTIKRVDLPTDPNLDAALQTISKTTEQSASNPHPPSPSTIYVNATGIRARTLCNDTHLYPARGQTLIVRGEAKGCSTRQGPDYIAYCIPRPSSGTTILGGMKQIGVWDEAEDKEATKMILKRAKELCPELMRGGAGEVEGEFEVLGVNVGLRPMREGGARMEREMLESGRVVFHAYGHGGAGFQNSVGVAVRVLEMIREDMLGRGVSASIKL